jgi:hypothetical protein
MAGLEDKLKQEEGSAVEKGEQEVNQRLGVDDDEPAENSETTSGQAGNQSQQKQ